MNQKQEVMSEDETLKRTECSSKSVFSHHRSSIAYDKPIAHRIILDVRRSKLLCKW